MVVFDDGMDPLCAFPCWLAPWKVEVRRIKLTNIQEEDLIYSMDPQVSSQTRLNRAPGMEPRLIHTIDQVVENWALQTYCSFNVPWVLCGI